ncbi:hypothetical protein VitviT2T_014236 [Vitis vinifera]|uniref:Beta-ketoacyl synthase C-terminal domain-containing protein n=2 Tax=Vitis vinifera TaxID=29760 RepID=A0ABY9CLJ5_VITVI
MCYSIDAIEANAIKFIFSDHATSGSLGLSSIKCVISHLLGVARAMETMFCSFNYTPCKIP